MFQVAVLQFPGSNCEEETARAAQAAGMEAEIFRWNRPASELRAFDAYILGGGFSYQDRVRAGVIAAKEPILEEVVRAAQEGKPVLGICNGAQILVETGLVPGGGEPGTVEMALAPNRMVQGERVVRRDYYCVWTHVRLDCPPGRCDFSRGMSEGVVFPLPIAHGEGRFTTHSPQVLERLRANRQIVLRYCTEDGEMIRDFPVNPNGAVDNIAGLCNPEGNVFALMPHPERASWLRQIPMDLEGPYGEKRRSAVGDLWKLESAGPGRMLFDALRRSLEEGTSLREVASA